MLNNFFGNPAIYEIMCNNIVEPGRPQMTIWRKCLAYWIPKSINTHSEYVIRIAFSLQQWLHEHTSMLHYVYIACLVLIVLTKYYVDILYIPTFMDEFLF